MSGIDPDVIYHKLSIKEDAKPVKQKPKRMNEERSHAISDEIDRLLQVGFIQKIFYPDWLSNLVLENKRIESRESTSTLQALMNLDRMTVIPF